MNSAYENPQPKDTSSSSGSSFRLPAAPPSLKPIYIITPTFRRPEQLAEITRLGNTLRNVQNVYWLVVEDANVTTVAVTKLLQIIGVPFEHMIGECKTEEEVSLPLSTYSYELTQLISESAFI